MTRLFAICLSLLCILLLHSAAQAITGIDNTVSIAKLQEQTLHVITVISGVSQPELELAVPIWTPGHYVIEDYARNISRLAFYDQAGRALAHRKIQDAIWSLDTRGASQVKIEFDFAADTLRPSGSKIAPTYAILNGTNFFFYVPGHTQDVAESVTFKLPDGWRVATGLTATADSDTFIAENYDVLVDCPALVGEFDSVTLSLRGVPHRVVVAPKGLITDSVLQKYAADTLKVIDAQTQVFGEIPYHDYTIINVFAAGGAGALEHLNSYVSILPNGPPVIEYLRNFLSDTAHEVFHAYNVKRIRPTEMFPYRYNERNYTPLLWVAEGITRYYEARGLLRAGFLKPEDYCRQQAQILNAVQADPAANYVSVEEASASPWQGGRFTVDYYSRGAALGLLLDLSIRHDTANAASLDDVMRALYYNFYKRGKGYSTSDLLSVINRLTKKDYGEFFRKYVGGTEPLPYDQVLSYAGLRLEETKNKVPSLGFQTDNGVIASISAGGAAETAGAKLADVFLGIGNINSGQPNWVGNYQNFYADKEGETATMYLLRDRKPLYLNFKIKFENVSSWNLAKLRNADKRAEEIFSAWNR